MLIEENGILGMINDPWVDGRGWHPKKTSKEIKLK